MTAESDRQVILFVDDSKTVRMTARKILEERYQFIEAEDGQQAIELVGTRDDIAIIFVDLQMPKVNGMQLLSAIRSSDDPRTAQLPIIMITGHDDSEAAMRAVFDMGATDFIAKPFDAIDLSTKAYSYINLTSRINELETQSRTDPLTGLSNNQDFLRLGEQSISMASRHKLPCSLVFIEIENLRDLYKQYGRNICDQIVTTMASRIGEGLRKEEIIARIGMSRFAMMLPMTNGFKTKICIGRIIDRASKLTFATGNKEIHVSLVAGIATVDAKSGYCNMDEFMLQTDTALQMAFSKSSHIAAYVEPTTAERTLDTLEDPDDAALRHLQNGDFEKLMHDEFSELRKMLGGFAEYVERQKSN